MCVKNDNELLYLKEMFCIIDYEVAWGHKTEKSITQFLAFFSLLFFIRAKKKLQGFVLFIVKWRLIRKYFSEPY